MKISSMVHYSNTVGLEVLVTGFPCSRPVLLSNFIKTWMVKAWEKGKATRTFIIHLPKTYFLLHTPNKINCDNVTEDGVMIKGESINDFILTD